MSHVVQWNVPGVLSSRCRQLLHFQFKTLNFALWTDDSSVLILGFDGACVISSTVLVQSSVVQRCACFQHDLDVRIAVITEDSILLFLLSECLAPGSQLPCPRTFPIQISNCCLASLSSDNMLAVSCDPIQSVSGNDVLLVDLDSGAIRSVLSGHRHPLIAVDFFAETSLLVTVTTHTFHIWQHDALLYRSSDLPFLTAARLFTVEPSLSYRLLCSSGCLFGFDITLIRAAPLSPSARPSANSPFSHQIRVFNRPRLELPIRVVTADESNPHLPSDTIAIRENGSALDRLRPLLSPQCKIIDMTRAKPIATEESSAEITPFATDPMQQVHITDLIRCGRLFVLVSSHALVALDDRNWSFLFHVPLSAGAVQSALPTRDFAAGPIAQCCSLAGHLLTTPLLGATMQIIDLDDSMVG